VMNKGRASPKPLGPGKYGAKIVSASFDDGFVSVYFQITGALCKGNKFRAVLDLGNYRCATQFEDLIRIAVHAGFASLAEVMKDLNALIGLPISVTIWSLDCQKRIPRATRYAWAPGGCSNALPTVNGGKVRKGLNYKTAASHIASIFKTEYIME